MNTLEDIPQILVNFPELEKELNKFDFQNIKVRMDEIKTEKHLKDAAMISRELEEALRIIGDFNKKNINNGANIAIANIAKTIRLRKNLFETRCARAIVITKFQ